MATILRGFPTPLFDRIAADGDARLSGDDALRESIGRDVARLVNTRSRLTFEAFAQSDGSVLDYGVPDFAERSPHSGVDRDEIAAIVAHAIALYEPRLTDVGVTCVPTRGPAHRVVLRISARMLGGELADHVAFELAPDGNPAAQPYWIEPA